jgi:dTDP-D-glucose 4,6-dehydratase
LFIEDDIPKNEIYNISSDEIYSNKEILELILSNYKIGDHSTFDDYVTRVNNRKGEDKIYRVNSQKFKDASYWNIYWSYSCDFNIASNIKEIYDWCKQNIVNLP